MHIRDDFEKSISFKQEYKYHPCISKINRSKIVNNNICHLFRHLSLCGMRKIEIKNILFSINVEHHNIEELHFLNLKTLDYLFLINIPVVV